MISKRLLIHSCTVLETVDVDANGNEKYNKTPLEGVRITPVYKTRAGAVGEEKEDSLTLFIDGVHSVPAGFYPKERDKVLWQGKKYTVRSVTPCYTAKSDTIHHVKVGLV